MPDLPKLADRIKEISYTTGTGSIELGGASAGFSAFSSAFSSGDITFYAITDGTRYEVGSGVFLDMSVDQIQRFAISSSNNNSLVDFPAGLKEVFATYPASHAVHMASGFHDMGIPAEKGVAFWSSDHVLNYDSNIIWDTGTSRLGINKDTPLFKVHVGGGPHESVVRTSGIHIGSSGILFESSGAYTGGRQILHFEQTTLADAHIESVLEVSGNVNQHLWLKKQNEGLIFAGPASGSCGGNCDPAYPTFRAMSRDDYPFLMTASGSLNKQIIDSGTALDTSVTIISGIAHFASGDAATNANVTLVSGIAAYASGQQQPLSGILSIVSGLAVYASGNTGEGLVQPSDFDIVSGLAVFASGFYPNIDLVSGIAVYSSGAISNSVLSMASGTQLDSDVLVVSGLANYASGQHVLTRTDFNIMSGIADFASGGIESISGSLNNRFEVIKVQVGSKNMWQFSGVGIPHLDNKNPILKLRRGEVYEFNINAIGHPLLFNSQPNVGFGDWNLGPTSGVTNAADSSWTDVVHNGTGVQLGLIRFRVPQNAPAILWYNCYYHSSMSGQIQIETPPTPIATSGMPNVIGVVNPNFAPTSSLSPGTSGTIVFDSGHLYVRVPSGHATIWKRTQLDQF
jgi:hypothetical protein